MSEEKKQCDSKSCDKKVVRDAAMQTAAESQKKS